jgi:polysaccharide export outer membrane protein
MRVIALLLPLAMACLAGCSTPKLVGRPGLELVSTGELPPPARQDLLLQQRSYLIGPLDKVTIDIYGVPELSRTTNVAADGTLSLPLLGTIQAMGLSSTELAQQIAKGLDRYVRTPQVTVNVDTANQTLTVDGEVTKPGLYPVNGRLTLMRAIAQAEGATEFANLSYVTVYRQVNKQQMAALYDVRAIRQGMYADPEVYANDFILVSEDRGARTFRFFLQGSGLLVAPIVALLQR